MNRDKEPPGEKDPNNNNNNSQASSKFKGPVFKLKPVKFMFNEGKARDEKEHLMNKRKEIGLPGADPIKRTFFPKNSNTHKNKPRVPNTFLKESLTSNPHYMVRKDMAKDEETLDHDQNMNDSMLMQMGVDGTKPHEISRSSSKEES